jgi:hypothetical protein
LPQFRVSLSLPGHGGLTATEAEGDGEAGQGRREEGNGQSLRIHFIHARSPSPTAIPLLLLPAFPFSNLSLAPLLRDLHSPAEGNQAFHVIIPSFPGQGFSDPLTSPPSVSTPLRDTAYLCDALMRTCGHERYLVSMTGSGTGSPSGMDYHLARILAERHEGCVGVHLIDPVLRAPRVVREPVAWAKWVAARFFHANVWGYTQDDWAPTEEAGGDAEEGRAADVEAGSAQPHQPTPSPATGPSTPRNPQSTATRLTTHLTSLIQRLHPSPNLRPDLPLIPSSHLSLPSTLTLAYALCDSPTGLLSLALLGLQRLAPAHTLTHEEIIDMVQLAWLPGPEGALRFWSCAAAEVTRSLYNPSSPAASGTGFPFIVGEQKPKTAVSITSFSGGRGVKPNVICPIWAESQFRITDITRREGRRGLPWSEPEVVVEGVRRLAGRVWSEAQEGGADFEGVTVHSPDDLPATATAAATPGAHHHPIVRKPLVPPQSSDRAREAASMPPPPPPAPRADSITAAKPSPPTARGAEIILEETEPESPDAVELQDLTKAKDKEVLRFGDLGLERPQTLKPLEEFNSSETMVEGLSAGRSGDGDGGGEGVSPGTSKEEGLAPGRPRTGGLGKERDRSPLAR